MKTNEEIRTIANYDNGVWYRATDATRALVWFDTMKPDEDGNLLPTGEEIQLTNDEIRALGADPWEIRDALDRLHYLNHWDATISLMDDEIREKLHNEMAPCDEDEFLVAYLKAHWDKYDEEFTI